MELTNSLYESLIRVLLKFKNSNFIQMTTFALGNVSSDDLKAFNDYFELEPERMIYGDWDILKFSRGGKTLKSEDYIELRKEIDLKIDELRKQEVKQTQKEEKELKYYDYGWLSPQGKYYRAEWLTHQTKAREILEELNLINDYEEMNDSENLTEADYLSKYKNFILIHSPTQGIPYPTILEGKRLTSKQKDFLYDFYMERNYVSLAYKYFNE